jgi:uncharacterized protein
MGDNVMGDNVMGDNVMGDNVMGDNVMSAQLPVRKVEVTSETKPFWDATASGQLALPRCQECSASIWYPRGFCPVCSSTSIEWVPSSGRGVVYSFSITRKGAGVWADHSPYVVAYVELEEGPRVLTNIVDCPANEVHIGMAVAVVFHPTEEGPAVYRFAPTAGS